jgi:hypothetical protein
MMVIANDTWAPNVGTLLPDGSGMGLIAKFKLRTTDEGNFTVIPAYLPPTKGDQVTIDSSNTALNRLTKWMRGNNVSGKPIEWLTGVISKWITVAGERQEYAIVLGDFNSAPQRENRTRYNGANGPLSRLTGMWNMMSTLDHIIPVPYHTFWQGETPVSAVDHILIDPNCRNLIHKVAIDTRASLATMMQHKPILASFNLSPAREKRIELPDPPTPVELNLSMKDGEFIHQDDIKAMNTAVEEYISKIREDYDLACATGPSPELADRILLHLQAVALASIDGRQNNAHKRFRGKPNGWSPAQVLLHAQIEAMIEIRRHMFGLANRRQWQHDEVSVEIHRVTENWRGLLKKYGKDAADNFLILGMNPEQLEAAPVYRLSRSYLDDIIDTLAEHLHHAQRNKKRLKISAFIFAREAKYNAGKLKAVINSVMQKEMNQFKWNSIKRPDGSISTDHEEMHTLATDALQVWHSEKVLHPLAEYMTRHPTLWEDFDLQRGLSNREEQFEGHALPPGLLQLFTEALLHTEHLDELRSEMAKVLTEPINPESFDKAISIRSNNKSPGITGFTINMMKQLNPDVRSYIFDLLNDMWVVKYIPEWWKDRWVVLVPKVTTQHVPLDKLRPICLLETTRKVWTAMLMTKIMGVLNKHGVLQDQQAGFRSGFSTEVSLMQFINTLEQAEQNQSTLYYNSFDISKAFDRPTKTFIKMAWTRLGVPPEIAQWLVDLDINGRAYVKSPWAKHLIKGRERISQTSCTFFTPVTGVPQGSSEGGATWVALFDILLTMFRLDTPPDIYRVDTRGEASPQFPTAFADDLMTYASTPERMQAQADVMSVFCMMSGLEVAPAKMVTRGVNTAKGAISTITVLDLSGAPHVIPIDVINDEPSTQMERDKEMALMRYLGIYVEITHTWTGQYKMLQERIKAITRVLSSSRASIEVKWYAMSMSGYAALLYPAKFGPWPLEKYEELFRPLDAALRLMSGNMRTIAPHMLYGNRKQGGLQFSNMTQRVQNEKIRILQRMQIHSAMAATTMEALLIRQADVMAIPHTAGSPILLGELSQAELAQYPCWATSMIQHINKQGYALGMMGCPHQEGSINGVEHNTRVPRPITGSGKNIDSTAKWLEQYDVMTYGDLMVNEMISPDPDHVRTVWRNILESPNEPTWWRQVRTMAVPIGHDNTVIMRRGMMICISPNLVIEYLGRVHHSGDWFITGRRWTPVTGTVVDDQIAGNCYSTSDGYHGMAGPVEFTEYMISNGHIMVYTNMPNHTILAEGISPFDFVYAPLVNEEPVPPIFLQLDELFREQQMGDNITAFTDGSFKLADQPWRGTVMGEENPFSEPPTENHWATGGIIWNHNSPNWRRLPMIAVHIGGRNTTQAGSAFPMELLSLIFALAYAKHRNETHRVISDCQSAIDIVQPSIDTDVPAIQSKNSSFITMAGNHRMPAGIRIEKVKSHVEERSSKESDWTYEEYGNVLADEAAGSPHYDSEVALQKRFKHIRFLKTTVSEMVQQLTPSNVWNIYTTNMVPVPNDALVLQRDIEVHKQYLAKRTINSAAIGRNRDWNNSNLELAAWLWRMPSRTKREASRINRILYDLHYHGQNKTKDITLTQGEAQILGTCPLCGGRDSQAHIVTECSNPVMMEVRRVGMMHIEKKFNNGRMEKSSNCHITYMAMEQLWKGDDYDTVYEKCSNEPGHGNSSTPKVEIWLGRWSTATTKQFVQSLRLGPGRAVTTTAVKHTLRAIYGPIIGTVFVLYNIRSALLANRRPQDRLSGLEPNHKMLLRTKLPRSPPLIPVDIDRSIQTDRTLDSITDINHSRRPSTSSDGVKSYHTCSTRPYGVSLLDDEMDSTFPSQEVRDNTTDEMDSHGGERVSQSTSGESRFKAAIRNKSRARGRQTRNNALSAQALLWDEIKSCAVTGGPKPSFSLQAINEQVEPSDILYHSRRGPSDQQVGNWVDTNNMVELDRWAVMKRLPGIDRWQLVSDGLRMCLTPRNSAVDPMNGQKWELDGDTTLIPPNQHIYDENIRDIIYGVEFKQGKKRFRVTPGAALSSTMAPANSRIYEHSTWYT